MFNSGASPLEITLETLRLLITLAPFWLPVLLALIWWTMWRRYLTIDYISKMKWTLLEIRFPLDILKSPLSMEVVLTSLFQPGGGNIYERFWLGRVVQWFSLEIVSIEGDVRFYIRTHEKFKNMIESRLYSQYPGAEIREVEDYVNEVEYRGNGSPWNVWGMEYKLAKPDPYPIKTYVDYELDRQTFREEQEAAKIDPLVALIENFSIIGKGEQYWFQILLRASKKEFSVPGTWFQKRDWRKEGKELIKKLKEEEGKNDEIKAIEKSINKHGFDCGIRMMYCAKKEVYDGGRPTGLRVILEPFNSELLNGFKRASGTDNDVPLENYAWSLTWNPFDWLTSVEGMKKTMFEAYRSRSWFYPPYKNETPPFVLNTEEIATLYHFPGRVLETPSFVRITTKRSEPPINLPT